ncbi:MAG TPA: PrsW family glutamic-type intramembrane protease [Polyangiaceae bacterium]|nr:PrsW family glutamic-type intramembrane protease [Polyangiaceae bacterium]
MTFGRVAAAFVFAALPAGGATWLVRRVRRERDFSTGIALFLAGAGALSGVATYFVERAVLSFGELSVEVSRGTSTSALLALFLFVAPLEEAAKLVAVWPTMLTRRLTDPPSGLAYAVVAACGFAVTDSILYLSGATASLPFLRGLAGLFAHPFCAGLWGYGLGKRVQGRLWFGPAFLLAVAIHAVYDHIVFGRGPGYLAMVLPLLAAMVAVAWGALRDLSGAEGVHLLTLPLNLPEPPSLRAVRGALRRTEEPLLFRWIVVGALVNLGAVILFVLGASLVARKLGVDLSVADEADMRSNGPVLLLGAAVLASFPVSGYLVARASGVRGVLEPAFAAAVAIAGAVVLLSVTAPAAVIFAIALAPVAFGLACGGAWFGADS